MQHVLSIGNANVLQYEVTWKLQQWLGKAVTTTKYQTDSSCKNFMGIRLTWLTGWHKKFFCGQLCDLTLCTF